MTDLEHRLLDFDEIMEPARNLFRDGLTANLEAMGFFDAPASSKYHGAYEGGLFEHSANVAHVLDRLTRDCHLEWKRPESPLIVGMFHDLCKCDAYRHPNIEPPICVDGKTVFTPDTSKWERNTEQLLKGHGEKSVMLASRFLTLTMEEIACIRYHMGAFTDKSEWNDYTRAIHIYPNVLWTHHADMIASHVIETPKHK